MMELAVKLNVEDDDDEKNMHPRHCFKIGWFTRQAHKLMLFDASDY